MISVVWGARDLRGLHDKKKKGIANFSLKWGWGETQAEGR